MHNTPSLHLENRMVGALEASQTTEEKTAQVAQEGFPLEDSWGRKAE